MSLWSLHPVDTSVGDCAHILTTGRLDRTDFQTGSQKGRKCCSQKTGLVDPFFGSNNLNIAVQLSRSNDRFAE
ncbi:hypothetical protein Mapa_014730 [Marchantia paleacea]|nr:hypothetical protein Mapa_014730 [Marchantia paleacea]